MRYYNAEVKVYKRQKWKQYLITLPAPQPFKEKEKVIVYPLSEINEYMKECNLRNNLIEELKEQLQEQEQENKRLLQKLEDKSDKVEKSLLVINKMQNMLNRITNRGLFDRMFNRIPEDIQELLIEAPIGE